MFSELKETNRKLDRRIYELNTLFDLSKEFNLMAGREDIARAFKFALLGQMLIRTFVLIYKIDGENELLASSGLKETPGKKEMEAMFSFERDVVLVKSEERKNIPFLENNGLFALISVHFQGQKIAVIGVGERASREGYAETDFNYLRSLANLAVLSIQKTILLEERIEKERLEEEVNIARTIQRRLLPNPIPEIDGIDLAAVNISSSQVGGDYFDIIETPDGNHIMAIGDVTGKGIPASLLMANLQSMLHVLLPVDITLSEATGRINELIYQNTPSDKFITFFWAKYFHKENKLHYINAGHNPPYLLKAGSKKITTLQEGGLILGAMPTIVDYQETDVILESGDIVICFTDGITEAFNEELNEEYEEERLQKCILANRNKTASEIMNAIIEDAQNFTSGKQTDDITLILFKVR
jgi:sigma-B regulation protein RsbU (phosphoserine phosphatase)